MNIQRRTSNGMLGVHPLDVGRSMLDVRSSLPSYRPGGELGGAVPPIPHNTLTHAPNAVTIATYA